MGTQINCNLIILEGDFLVGRIYRSGAHSCKYFQSLAALKYTPWANPIFPHHKHCAPRHACWDMSHNDDEIGQERERWTCIYGKQPHSHLSLGVPRWEGSQNVPPAKLGCNRTLGMGSKRSTQWRTSGLPSGEQEVHTTGSEWPTQRGSLQARRARTEIPTAGKRWGFLSTLPRKISAKSAVGWNARGDILQAHHFSLI